MKNILLFTMAALAWPLFAGGQNRLYVSAAALGANNGQSWADAYTELQAALQAAQAGDEVWVAQGTYYPTGDADRAVSFEPKSGVRLYGGFLGNETALGQRDWTANATVLSGDIGVPGDSTDNSLTVVYLFQSDSSTVLDGFSICHGVANDASSAASSLDRAICGGGLYIEAGDWDAFPTIQNCLFWRNSAQSFGGGAMLHGSSDASVAPRFFNCRFEENRSLGNGGGLARLGGSWAERGVDFEQCAFSQNRASRGGGLYYADTKGPNTIALQGCSFMGNRAVYGGGGAYFYTGKTGKSGLYVLNCRFEANNAIEGAAMDIFNNGNDFNGDAIIDSCEFIRNNSHAGGNAPSIIYADEFSTSQSHVQLSSTRFEANRSVVSIISLNWLYSNVALNDFELCGDTALTLFSNSLASSTEVAKSRFSSNLTNRLVYINHESNNPYLDFSNCLFYKNQPKISLCDFDFAYIDSVFFTNCTFADNEDEQFLSGASDIILKNMIMSRYLPQYFFSTNNKFNFSFSALGSPDCQSLPPNVTCGPGNLFGLDPLFRDTANHDYSLLPCSPLIGAGSNAAVLGFSTDLAGNPRIQGGTVDIGAYEAPAFGLAAAPQVQPACAGASNGSITVQPVFGCEPYTYDWWPAAGNGPELNGLPPGSYRLTLTDGSGRQVLDTLEVAEAPNPVLSPEAVDVQCTNSLGGSITAATAGGEPPYHYQWWPAAADTSALAQLAAGAYAVTVTDANGCLDSASLELALLGALTLSVDGGSIACFGGTGWLSATPSTGAAPFDWDWAGWPGMGPVAEPLGPGQYAVTVSDAYGCTSAFSFPPMAQPDSLWATVGALPQTDLAAPNGVAVVTTISGGTPSYQYAWSTGGSGQSVEGLTAGAYTVTVTDQHGCAAVTEVTVELMVGTGEAEGRALLLWPNPAADWLKVAVTGSSRARWLDLTDASGRRALRRPMASDECLVDLRGLPGGPYVVTVRDGDGKGLFVGKVLKN